ncbi:MAG: MFS transporter [Smithellaceae bacterium]|nr:MFS transporter [Syntrophaceae bacterium]MDD4240623.1 MFS transporter [Smithellaceae bacterium]
MTETPRAPRKELFGWAMFDFANSSYTTVIITVVFCVIFPRLIVADGPEFRLGNLLWSVSLSVSYLLVLLTAPVLGAIMDYTGAKKKFLFASCLLTVVATAALYFVRPGGILLGMLFIILSNIGFSYSESFVSSFLPGLGPPEDLGKISGWAWGLGYFGGLLSTALVMFGLGAGVYTLENFPRLRWVGPVTGAFFLVAAIPTFLWVKERAAARPLPPGENYFTIGFKRLRRTFSDIREYRDLMILLGSFFFAYAGLSIVISFAFIYGDQVVRWSAQTQMLMFVITQFTAAGGALLFGVIQDRWKAKQTFILTLVIWVVAVTLIYGVGPVTEFLNRLWGTSFREEHVFLVIGSLAGLGLGSTQSACRAMVGLFSPDTKAGEFFGLWSFTSRLSAIVGLMGLGLLQTLLGLQRAVLVCSVFFFIALVVILFVDVERGKRIAREHAGE